jgi:cell division septation protein DedD
MNTDARQASTSSEDGFHEIHLSGKQLVFLFMATTVVSIVIFLCGVLVGRGVRTEASSATALPTPVETATAAAPADASAATGAEATNVGASELSYYDRLGGAEPPAETVKSGTEVPEVARPASPPPAGAPARREEAMPAGEARAPRAAAAPEPSPQAAAPATAAPGGWAVQVAAVRQRAEADTIAARLKQKGYDAYVVAPATGSSTPMYRVRVGSYADRSEAEQMMRRLADQERFKPWITR